MEFCRNHQFSEFFVLNYLIPMGAAIWSASFDETTKFPAKSFLQFWHNHCLLQVNDRPVWRTIKNGSKSYIEAMEAQSNWTVYTNTPVQSVRRQSSGATVYLENGNSHQFDAVILATHADQSLKIIESATKDEEQLLGAWNYSSNQTILHTDTSCIPKQKSAWASWMVRDYGDYQLKDGVSVTYLMNRLQRLKTKETYLVSLNTPVNIDEQKQLRTIHYEHPIFNQASLETQSSLSTLNQTGPVYYCGAYFGYGFHEDGVRSGVDVAKALGGEC